MAITTRAGRTTYTWLALAAVLVLLLAAVLWTATRDSGETRLTAYFDRTVGLYQDSAVRVLGVEVGTIDRVVPEGDRVRVDLVVDSDVDVPSDAGAVIVAPSLVSDRYIQLTPVYRGGPRMASGEVIPRERTAAPVELDELFNNLDELATTLGPKGANSGGSLSNVLDQLAATMDGNGKNLNNTVSQLARLSDTLNGSKDDLHGTIKHLGEFTTMLAKSDRQVADLFDRVADVSQFLASESGQVDAALATLASALTDVRGFVDDNQQLLSSNVDKLAGVTRLLVKRRAELAEILDVAPTGMNNFINAYDAPSGTIAIRGNLNEFTYPPVMMVCRLLAAGTPQEVPDVLAKTCKDLAPVLDGTLKLPSVSQVMHSLQNGELPPLPLPVLEAMRKTSGGGS
ncbi:MCE family protein [Haloechinothrix halophila]|uniref:MCE family protein n=1 Tax=Haloechinothrix halophila TaxID=1069073 RepID=UPI000401CB2A|nr:MCE family protein [Haloechinothrix halophila]